MTGELGFPILSEDYTVLISKSISSSSCAYAEDRRRGKESDRLAGFTNYRHYNLRYYKSGVVSSALKIKAPANSERPRAAAARASRIFTQERVKSSWKPVSQLWVVWKVAGKIFVPLYPAKTSKKWRGSASAQLNRLSRNS